MPGSDAAMTHSARGRSDAWLIETWQTGRYTSVRKPVGAKLIKFTEQQTRQLLSTNPITQFVMTRIAPLLLKLPIVQRIALTQLTGLDTPFPQWLEPQNHKV